ncbi:MAG: sterol desaturase family protein [Nitrospirae bacterium]|nr:sterol desaturase family protein [Candidatus Manganitrophaceae bacterium]
MDIFLTPTGLRGIVSFGGLFLFMAVENFFPFRKRVDPILRHYGLNLLIAGGNSALLGIALGGAVVGYARFLETRGIGLLHLFPVSLGWNISLSLLYLDFVTYLWHMAYHRSPLLWRLHRVHHTDRDLDVTSASRFHLGEIGLSTLLRLGVMTALGPAAISIVIFEGTLLLAAQFQHSNFKIAEPVESAVRWLFVTPDMHRVHHSDRPAETNSNFSTIFSFWDRLIGTYRMAPQERLVIGLKEYLHPKERTFLKLMAMPFGRPCSSAITEQRPTTSREVET